MICPDTEEPALAAGTDIDEEEALIVLSSTRDTSADENDTWPSSRALAADTGIPKEDPSPIIRADAARLVQRDMAEAVAPLKEVAGAVLADEIEEEALTGG